MKKVSLILVIAILVSSFGVTNAGTIENNNFQEMNSGDIVIQVEPGAERYTVVYEYGTAGHYITKSEQNFYFYTNASFWAMLGSSLQPLAALPFTFAGGTYYLPQYNDFIRPYTAVTYDALMDRFEWTLHTTSTRNGVIVDDRYQTTYFNRGSAGFSGLMQKYGYLIPASHLKY